MTWKIMTEDDVLVQPGDRVYNYYDMCPGTITEREPRDYTRDGRFTSIKKDLWFEFQPDGGGVTILNGERICSMAFARARGFRNAEEQS